MAVAVVSAGVAVAVVVAAAVVAVVVALVVAVDVMGKPTDHVNASSGVRVWYFSTYY